MKRKFRKFQIISTVGQQESLMESLQQLGVLHLQENDGENYSSDMLEQAIHERNKIAGILDLLDPNLEFDQKNQDQSVDSIKEVIDKIIALQKQIEHLDQEIENALNEADRLTPWGDFSYARFQPLLDLGYHVLLCVCPKKVFDQLDFSSYLTMVLSKEKANVYFSIVTKNKDLNLPVEYFSMPDSSYREQLKLAEQKKAQKKQLLDQIASYSSYVPVFTNYYAGLIDQVSFYQAGGSLQWLASGNIVGITGWVPENKAEQVESFLKAQHIAYKSRAPVFGEQVPVVLKNSRYTRLFEPITKIFELPNYYEKDTTPFIAVFYPILFAYCLGDAGYGALLLVGSLAGYFTFFKGSRNIALLGVVLGIMTTIMGLVKSGSLFGIPLSIEQNSSLLSFLGTFVLIPDDSEFIFNAFNVALMIGVVQILTGIILSIYNKAQFEHNLQALSAVGKLFIVVSLIWIFLTDMQQIEALQAASWIKYSLLAGGVLLVMFFHEPELSIVRRAFGSVMPLFFIFTGILGDILSFVRLFALGLASSVLGLVVNQIGQQIMSGGAVSVVIGILFLLFGHTLNFGIAALGSFVHPLRLTFVEFYGNADFEGKGVVYRPFKKTLKTSENT